MYREQLSSRLATSSPCGLLELSLTAHSFSQIPQTYVTSHGPLEQQQNPD